MGHLSGNSTPLASETKHVPLGGRGGTLVVQGHHQRSRSCAGHGQHFELSPGLQYLLLRLSPKPFKRESNVTVSYPGKEAELQSLT